MSIFESQRLYNLAVIALELHGPSHCKCNGFVEISVAGTTKGMLLSRVEPRDPWDIARIYTSDRYMPGEVGVFVRGVW